MKKLYLLWLTVCAVLLTALGGCATLKRPDVGAVVIAPQAQLPALPVLVQQTQPYPVGYFLQSFLDYFSSDSSKPTGSTTPMPVAAP